MDTFYQCWFKGFSESLAEMSEADRERFFANCSRSCSDIRRRAIYIKEYEASSGMEDFLARLKRKFSEIEARYDQDAGIVTIMYYFCNCNLVRDGYVNTPLVCECSRQSLIHNWTTVLGKDVEVKTLETILSGGSCCKFEIQI